MADDFERRLADSLRYGAAQAQPADVTVTVPRAGWRGRFERRLADSLRYGAAQARPGADPAVPGRRRAGHRPPGPRSARPGGSSASPPGRPARRPLAVALAGIVAVLVIALPAVVRQQRLPGAPVPTPTVAGGTGHPGTVAPSLLPWRLDAGLFDGSDGSAPLGREATPDGDPVYLIVRVAPQHADGKTYLQQYRNGRWVRLGPHNTDLTSRVVYALRPPPAGVDLTYRVFVPAAGDHADAYSVPIVLHGLSG
jgi:hypothetical protein